MWIQLLQFSYVLNSEDIEHFHRAECWFRSFVFNVMIDTGRFKRTISFIFYLSHLFCVHFFFFFLPFENVIIAIIFTIGLLTVSLCFCFLRLLQDCGFQQGANFPTKDTWQSLEAFCFNSRGMGTTGIYWEEARNVAKHHIMHRTAPTNKISQLKMSTVPKLRNLALVFIKCLSNFYLPSNVTNVTACNQESFWQYRSISSFLACYWCHIQTSSQNIEVDLTNLPLQAQFSS